MMPLGSKWSRRSIFPPPPPPTPAHCPDLSLCHPRARVRVSRTKDRRRGVSSRTKRNKAAFGARGGQVGPRRRTPRRPGGGGGRRRDDGGAGARRPSKRPPAGRRAVERPHSTRQCVVLQPAAFVRRSRGRNPAEDDTRRTSTRNPEGVDDSGPRDAGIAGAPGTGRHAEGVAQG